ncbi:tyrosine protein phosphatase yvh1 [Paramarasmius palmivorus]|uniref:protein-tyrosine-phosphatase n=1 Tax=Paramarasmius palmivorus TaxID=297713 RepID=A0AAW0E6A8_9AGAR
MDEIIPGLWIGDIRSATDVETLKANNIFSILSAMRGKISIHETFIKHQLLLDDTEETDILQHFLPSISFIQAELNKGRGVLVHCQAGISRSSAIVAAYLMYDRHLTPDEALDLIRKARPSIDPNPGFLLQLEIFYNASYKITGRDKTTRMWYMERTVEEVLNGDGSIPSTDMFAKFPLTPSASTPNTPGGHRGPRRRIRCKMCRQELAAREHMLDHGQIGPATPASITPAASRRGSTNTAAQLSRNPSLSMTPANAPAPVSRHPSMKSDTRPRRPSGLGMGGLTMSSLDGLKEDGQAKDTEKTEDNETPADGGPKRQASAGERRPSSGRSSGLRPFQNLTRTMMDSLSMSALETEDEESDDETTPKRRHGSNANAESNQHIQLGRRLSDAMMVSPPTLSPSAEVPETTAASATVKPPANPNPNPNTDPSPPQAPYFASPADLADQLNANPKLAALKSPVSITPDGITPLQTQGLGSSSNAVPSPVSRIAMPPSAPILINPKCSGYFVEPMKWMEPFLEEGQIAGKIICPNKKCGAKLGNYDWAGGTDGASSKGFCINRSKVDEVVH